MKKSVFILLFLLVSFQYVQGQDFNPLSKRKHLPAGEKYSNPSLSPAERAKDLLMHMTFQEKLEMTGGQNKMFFPGIPRLGLRPVRMSDASQGVHLKPNYEYMKNKVSTSFPAELALASTWNPGIAKTVGRSIGEECRALGVDILLGPGINMYRTSEGGRNFEYMGEDPYLTSRMVVPYVKGLQSTKVIATAKHFLCNDQEAGRHIASSDVDAYTLREIYLPPWNAAIKRGGLKAVMTGNNLVNGVPNSMNKSLLEHVLRKDYGFTGIAMTDWQNTCYHPNKQNLVLPSGESLLMPTNQTFANFVTNYLKEHPDRKQEIEKEVEKMIYPNILTLFEMGVYDRSPVDLTYNSTYKVHKKVARHCADQAICLLKNKDKILPVSKGKKILMMGSPEIVTGKGSGFVQGYDQVDFSTGLKKVYGIDFKCIQHPSDDEIRAADVVLYRLNKKAGEGEDVPFDMPKGEKKEIMHITSLNPNIVVLVSACNGLDMSWLPYVKGVLWCYYLGQERGDALADVVSGKVNPSGHLPFSIEKYFCETPDPTYNYIGGEPYWCGDNQCYKNYWLGNEKNSTKEIAKYIKPHEIVHFPYKEGIFIGYRWYEKYDKPVWFPFGFGLSYTTFSFKGLKLSSDTMMRKTHLKVQCEITNTGKRNGAQVVQMYIRGVQSKPDRPVKELKGFKKVFLSPGETKTITFIVNKHDIAFWSTANKKWKSDKGDYQIQIGSSSSDISLKKIFHFE